MQPWMSASQAGQQAAQQSQQNAIRAAQESARSGMDAGRAAAEASMRGAQFRSHTMHTGSSSRRSGGGFGFFRLVGGLFKLAILAGIILVAVKLIGGV